MRDTIYSQIARLDSLERRLVKASSRADIAAIGREAAAMRGAEAARIAAKCERLVKLMQAARI